MATKKAGAAKDGGAPAPLARSTRSFEHGKDAAGAKYVRGGFAWTAADDLAFALGFPYVSYLVEGHPDDAEANVEARADLVIKKAYSVNVPAKIGLARARVFPILRVDHTGAYDKAVVLPLVERDDPMTADEATKILADAVRDVNTRQGTVLRTLQLLEAFVGPSAVAKALVTALEALPNDRLAAQGTAAIFARYLGFSLLRVIASEADALRDRIERLVARVPTEFFKRSAREALDIALGKLQRGADDGAFVLADPEKVRSLVAADPGPKFAPNARLAFLGGDPVIDFYVKNAKKLDPNLLPDVVVEFGPMRGERALRFKVMLAATSKAKNEALASFVERAAETRPFLETAAASSGDEAAWAKAVLAKLPKA
jgi:hypothetical protein